MMKFCAYNTESSYKLNEFNALKFIQTIVMGLCRTLMIVVHGMTLILLLILDKDNMQLLKIIKEK